MAANKYLQIENIGNSYMGTVYCTPKYGKYAGQMIEMFHIKDFEVNFQDDVIERRTLNSRVKQKKVTGRSYSWSANVFNCTSQFNEIILEYEDNGTQPMFTMDLTNNWEQDGLGQQRYKATGVIIESGNLFRLNVDSEDEASSVSGSLQSFKLVEAAKTPDVAWS